MAYDLEARTLEYARRVRVLVKQLARSVWNLEDSRQVVRASGSVGANYIEANEALGRKDFQMHVRISRKEAKEARYWLSLLDIDSMELEKERRSLIDESTQLMRIFGAILRTTQRNSGLSGP